MTEVHWWHARGAGCAVFTLETHLSAGALAAALERFFAYESLSLGFSFLSVIRVDN